LLGGNFFQSKPEAGIYDASHGLLLKGDGKGNFSTETPVQSGITIRGAVRDIQTIRSGKKNLLIVAQNNEAPVIYNY
jgi:hypothetical protein